MCCCSTAAATGWTPTSLCALAVNRRLVVDEALTATASEICRAVDGLPLAIELAAAGLRSLTPAEVADGLGRPLAIGEHALSDLPDRQQTLEATIGWSYELLSTEEQATLRSAAVFSGGFTADALDAVVGRPAGRSLRALRLASLARRDAGGERQGLLGLVRAFALARLTDPDEERELRARHREWFAALVAPTIAAFDRGEPAAALGAPLIADHPNLRAALESAIAERDAETATTLALGMRPLWFAGTLRQEGQEFAERICDELEVAPETEMALLRAASFLDGGVARPDGKPGSTRRLLERATQLGNRDALANATVNLFAHAMNARDRDEPRRLRPALLEVATPDTDSGASGWIHYALALEAYVDGDFARATEHAARGVELAQAFGHPFRLAAVTNAWLLAKSARDGAIAHGELTATLEVIGRPGLKPLSVIGLWFVARYASGVQSPTAAIWLTHAERLVAELDTDLWPESTLREETATLVTDDEVAAARVGTASRDHQAALADATAWLGERDPVEQSVRQLDLRPTGSIRLDGA